MFARQELPVRREFGYPPVAAMIRIVVRGPVESTVEQFAEHVAARLRAAAAATNLEPRVLGPVAAPLPKLRGNFRFHMLLYHTDQPALLERRAHGHRRLEGARGSALDRGRGSGRHALAQLLWFPGGATP